MMISRAIATVVLAWNLACAPAPPVPAVAPGTPGYRAPTHFTIVGDVEPSIDVQELFITNNSSASVIVNSVHITDCVNVSPCGLVELQIRVDPTQRRRILDLRAIDTSQAWSYNWSYSWVTVTAR